MQPQGDHAVTDLPHAAAARHGHAQRASLEAALADRYTVDREIGRGGMAFVYRARDIINGRDVALKVLRPEMTAAVGAARFLREIAIEQRLSHPGILPLYDWGWAAGSLYYTMPHVAGETLRDRLARGHQLSLADAIAIARDIASALDYAHAEHVIHRDIKPANILLADGPALIADFGIARAMTVAGGDALTGSGVGLGTPEYMSPEQSLEARLVDGTTDIYALGCVFYEMLAGEPPFTGRNVQTVMEKHAKAPPPSLHIIRPSLPVQLDDAIARALAKAPRDRFQTAEQFIEAVVAATPDGEPAATLRDVGGSPDAVRKFKWPWQ
jgi:eukaryotic-like serine/threonine-protein kinase